MSRIAEDNQLSRKPAVHNRTAIKRPLHGFVDHSYDFRESVLDISGIQTEIEKSWCIHWVPAFELFSHIAQKRVLVLAPVGGIREIFMIQNHIEGFASTNNISHYMSVVSEPKAAISLG
jgi:hypothetical protein